MTTCAVGRHRHYIIVMALFAMKEGCRAQRCVCFSHQSSSSIPSEFSHDDEPLPTKLSIIIIIIIIIMQLMMLIHHTIMCHDCYRFSAVVLFGHDSNNNT